jgi:hypothetical protein
MGFSVGSMLGVIVPSRESGMPEYYAPELPTGLDELGPMSTTDSLSISDDRIFFARSSAFVEKRIGQPSGAFAIGWTMIPSS